MKRKRKAKKHYCPILGVITGCGRYYYGKVKTTPIPDLRSVTCEGCRRYIKKLREKKNVYIP